MCFEVAFEAPQPPNSSQTSRAPLRTEASPAGHKPTHAAPRRSCASCRHSTAGTAAHGLSQRLKWHRSPRRLPLRNAAPNQCHAETAAAEPGPLYRC